MSKYRYVDDIVLWKLWQEEEELTWQTAYKIYREPFVKFFQKIALEMLSDNECQEIYNKVFTILNIEITHNEAPKAIYLFHFLLVIGKDAFKDKVSHEKFKIETEKINLCLTGEILLEISPLLDKKLVDDTFYNTYKEIGENIVNRKWGFVHNNEAQESYGESMIIFLSKIKLKKIARPLIYVLFSYFLVIFIRKTRDDRRSWKYWSSDNKPINIKDINELREVLPSAEQADSTYFDFLMETSLKRFNFESNRDLVLKFIEWADEPLKTIVHLRYIEGERLIDIAKRLELTPGNVRIIVSRGIEKFRNFF